MKIIKLHFYLCNTLEYNGCLLLRSQFCWAKPALSFRFMQHPDNKLPRLTMGSERQDIFRECTDAHDRENRSVNILCFL